MLNYLSIKNVSVIESVSFELDKKLNVLTGETGSGKSVLVGALKLLLGDRFQKPMLREGADKLMVEAIFEDLPEIPALLKEQFNIEDELIIRREVDDSGRNRVFINGCVSTVSQLKEFAPYLADIHGQHEHQALLDESRHIDLIDHVVPENIKNTYSAAYKLYRGARRAKEDLLAAVEEMRQHKEMAEFQLAEIKNAEIDVEEDSQLEEKVVFLSHIEKIREAGVNALELISDGEINAASLVSKAMRAVSPIAEMVQEVQAVEETLTLAAENLAGASRMLADLVDRQEAPPQELDRLMQRKYMLQELVRKYGGSLEDVIAKGEELEDKLNSFQDSGNQLAKLEKEEAQAYQAARDAAEILLNVRREAAKRIASQVVGVLNDLELPDSRFLTVFTNKEELDSRGGVDGKFYISVNKGFEPAPLAQVASGGEISRIMLALKEVFSESDPISTLLFDEIDTGISGITAKKVAERLKRLSEGKQVIVITHLPVVAAKGDTHFFIKKDMAENTTKTTISKLGEVDREKIIASMIAGEPTDAALEQARELLAAR